MDGFLINLQDEKETGLLRRSIKQLAALKNQNWYIWIQLDMIGPPKTKNAKYKTRYFLSRGKSAPWDSLYYGLWVR